MEAPTPQWLRDMVWQSLHDLGSERSRYKQAREFDFDMPEELTDEWFYSELLEFMDSVRSLQSGLSHVSAKATRYRGWIAETPGADSDIWHSAEHHQTTDK